MGLARDPLGCKSRLQILAPTLQTILINFQIYEAGFNDTQWSYPPVVGEQGCLGSAASWAYGPNFAFFDPAKHNASDLISFPLRDQNRNALVSLAFTSTYYWFGPLANGTLIRPGTYT